MALRPVLSIDIRDGQFRDFMKLYSKYEAALKKAPAAWALVNKNIDGSRASFDKLVGQMAAANVQEQLRAKAQERADRLTRSSAERWQAMARDTREFARNIAGATTQLLKWGSLTGLISGLLGAGGLFGIDRLALSAAGSRRSALGLGATIGGQEAFKTSFSRFVDPEAFLASISEARTDIGKSIGLRLAGISEKEIQGGDTAQIGVKLLQRLKQIADTTNPLMYAKTLEALRLSQHAGPDVLRRLRIPGELEKMTAGFGQNATTFNLQDKLAERWQDFTTQMETAGKTIETVLKKGLIGLEPGLNKLSESVAKFFGVLLKEGGPVEKWIGELGHGLEKFAGYIGTPEFNDRVKAFVDGLGAMASVIERFVSGFGGGGRHGGANLRDHIHGRRIFSDKPLLDLGPLGKIDPKFVRGGFMDRLTGGSMTEAQLLSIVGKLEGGTTGQTNFAGAVGKYQIKPGTAAEHGIDPATLYNAAGNEAAARRIVHDYVKRYHGDAAAALAAYNQGTGAGDRFRKAGDDPRMLKPEGQQYLDRSRTMPGYGSSVIVTIDNKTDSTVSTSANGIRQGGP